MNKVSITSNKLISIIFLLALETRNTQSYSSGSSSSSQDGQKEKETNWEALIVGLVIFGVAVGIGYGIYRK